MVERQSKIFEREQNMIFIKEQNSKIVFTIAYEQEIAAKKKV